MELSLSEQLALEWSALTDSYSAPARQAALRLAGANDEQLATYFYEVMLEDQIASQFLTHEQVKVALHASMRKWVVSVFELEPGADFEAMVDLQIHVGHVHARVGVPVHVVLRGARALKKRYTALVQADSQIKPQAKIPILSFIMVSIDFAMEIMAGAYASSNDRSARAEESYRLFSMAQDVTAEKAHQRSALLNWENDIMYQHTLSKEAIRLPRIGASDFGLWFKHKGAHVFQGSYETDVIITAMKYIDNGILPALGGEADAPLKDDRTQSVRDLHEQVRLIFHHLERLFEERSELEAGRDALTRLLSRRFLDVILAKEVAYARQSGTKFALLALDVDYFKNVNDQYGHDAGDAVLKHLATVLSEHTRGGDYIFRMGGEEFMILLVDVVPAGAMRVAEKLRRRIHDEPFRIHGDQIIKITVSIGVALHDGHPDHARILRTADEALYRAKNGGRNSVVDASTLV